MSKKYIICGVSRAGKTTLARGLSEKYNCPYIPCDPLITAFQQVYPELGITHDIANDDAHYDDICKKVTTFLISYMADGLDEELDSYVLESFHIDIDMLQKALGDTHTIVVVGYPNIDATQKFTDIRTYDTIGRRADMSDEELQSDIAWFIHLSQRCEKIASECSVVFVDTSKDYTHTIQTAIAQL